MAVPVEIVLTPLINNYRDGLFTPENPALVTQIDVDDDAEQTVGAIHKEDFTKILFEAINDGANPADIFFYGAAENDINNGTNRAHSPPPDEGSADWFPLPNGTISGLTLNDARIITDNWTWIMITIARTNAGQSTTIDLKIRGV